MARVRDRHLGVIQGAVGDQVFKLRGSKSYLAQLPHSNGIAPTEKLVNIRKKFANAVKFAQAVNKIPAFKSIWDMVTPNEISPYNGIFKENYRYITSTDVMQNALVVPKSGGFVVVTTDVTISSTSVSVSLDPIGSLSGIDTAVEKFIQLGAVIKCTDNVEEDGIPLEFIWLNSANVVLNLANPLIFDVDLLTPQTGTYNEYDTHLTYFAFVTLDADGNAVRFSIGLTN